jgi:catechol 2,3-dioxygenase-like lactoylglutathione lyase family enzyme
VTVLFDHAGIETSSIEGDVRVYVEAFGLRRIRWGTHSLTGRRIAMLSDGQGVKLELIEVREPTPRPLAHVAFRTADLEGAHAGAIAAGCRGEGETRRIDAARAMAAMVRLPTGGLVQLIRYEPGSPDLAAVKGGSR